MTPEELGEKYGMVLLRTIEHLTQNHSTFKVALDAAAVAEGHTLPLPQEVETAILTSAFRIIANGGIPGAPDA